MKSIYYYAERDCYDDSSERTALAYIEARIVGAKAAKRAVENAIDGGQMYRGTVMGKVLPGNQWLLVSGHALERGIQRNISRSEITAHFDKFFANDDATFEMSENCLELCSKGCFSVVSETGKLSTFVEFEDDNVALIIEAYQYGFRIASCWNFDEEKRKYVLEPTNDYLFIRKDGMVTRHLSGRVRRAA